MDVSLVIPVYNEAQSLKELLPEAVQELAALGLSYEIIVADDASTDNTCEVVSRCMYDHPQIRLHSLAKNSKKAGALAAGFAASTGDIIVTIDGDLQDDPSNIAILIRALNEGADAVIGRKMNRQAPLNRRVSSWAFNCMCRLLFQTSFHDMNSGMKAYRRAVLSDLPLEGSLFRFGPIFLATAEWRVLEVSVMHRPRKFGTSKFGTCHRCRGIVDLLRVKLLLRGRERIRAAARSV